MCNIFSAIAQNTLTIGELYEYYSLDKIVDTYIDETNELTFEDVQTIDFQHQPILPPQPIKPTFWMRFKLQDTLHYDIKYRVYFPYMNYVSVFQPISNGAYEEQVCGLFDKIAPNEEVLEAHLAIIDGEKIDTSRYFYVRVKNFSRLGTRFMSSDIWLQPVMPDYLYQTTSKKTETENLIYALFLGLLFGLSVYFFLTYFFNKWHSFLMYSLYLAALFIYFLHKLPLLIHLWRETYPLLINVINDCSMILSSILYTLFVMSYLDLKRNYPKLYPLMVAYISILSISGIWYGLTLLLNRFSTAHLMFMTYELLFVTIFSVLFLVYLIWKGIKGTGWVVIVGSILLITGNGVAMLVGPFSTIIPFITVEVILFALGLSYQIRLNDLERLKTKEALIEQLKVNEKLQKEMQSKLEEEVKIQTAKAIQMTKAAEEAKAERTQSELLNELEKVKMKALQSQMNPHFIFNCLNSIRLYYLNNDLEKGDDYITKFSRLIRSILNFSRLEYISLKEELDALKLYMEFEQMRFHGKFNYTVKIDSALNPAEIQIQPLLLQPFVENAIWHGLMHNEREGIVSINITNRNNKSILIEITDNGIGRDKAKQFTRGKTQKKSYGLQITQERMDLFKLSTDRNASYNIIDLYDQEKNPLGTSVHIIYDI